MANTVTIRLAGYVDENHRLTATAPREVRPGPVEITPVVHHPTPAEDDAGTAWAAGIAREWAEELSDPREDIYTADDGKPV